MQIKNVFSKFGEFPILTQIFYICLILSTVLSGYIFFTTILSRDTVYENVFSTWQFPMLFAILADTVYLNKAWSSK